jgi:hypothetical protein
MTVSVEGNLKDFPLPDVMNFVVQAAGTGELELEGKDQERVIVKFEEGKLVSAEPTGPRAEKERVGSLLVRGGLITPLQLKEVLRIQKETLQKLGHILIRKGLIRKEDLRNILQVQVKETMFHLFQWQDGHYRFRKAKSVDYDHDLYTPQDANNMIMEGVRMVDEWPSIRKRIPSNGMVFRKSLAYSTLTLDETEEKEQRQQKEAAEVDMSNLDDLLAGLGKAEEPPEPPAEMIVPGKEQITRQHAIVFNLVDGKRSVEDVISLGRLGEFDTCRVLKELQELGFVEPVEAFATGGGKGRFAWLTPQRMAKAAVWGASIPVVLLAIFVLKAIIGGIGEETFPFEPFGQTVKETYESLKHRRIEKALEIYYFEKQGHPDSLRKLAATGYLRENDLRDPWGTDYQYNLKGKEGYVLFSVHSTREAGHARQ